MENSKIKTAEIKEKELKTVNQFEITGTIISKIRTKEAISFLVATQNQVTHVTDVPNIIVFQNHDAFDVFDKGDRITATGFVQTTKQHPKASLIATHMVSELSRFDATVSDETFKTDCNFVALMGTVVGDIYVVPKRPDLAIANVKVMTPTGYFAYPSVSFFDQLANSVRKCKEGDVLKILGSAHSDRKTGPNGNLIHHRSLVAQTLTVVK